MSSNSNGATSRLNGDSAEAAFSAACARYAARGEAWVVKRPTPVRPIGSPKAGGKFLAVWADKAGVDYTGCLYGGRAVFAELKSSSTPRLPLAAHGKARIKPEQLAELERVYKLGGLALLVVRLELKEGPAWWTVDFDALAQMLGCCALRGAKSVTVGDLDAYGRRCLITQPYDLPDWLWGWDGRDD